MYRDQGVKYTIKDQQNQGSDQEVKGDYEMCSKEGLKNITPTDREVLTAYEKIWGKTEEEFITYDVFLDCIHPGTGRPLTQKTDSALDRYNTFRNSDIDYDADVSLEANCIYEMAYQDLFAGEGRKTILRQPYDACFNRHGLKYEIWGCKRRRQDVISRRYHEFRCDHKQGIS